MIKLIVLLVLLPMMAFAADTKGGGGGIVIACYDKEGELTTVELLDLYEARKVKGLTLSDDFSGDFKSDALKIAAKVFKDKWGTELHSELMLRMTEIYRFIPRDAELELTNDAYPVFIPRGCKAKQVANYYNDDLIWVDEVLYEKMSYRDQLALAFHEMVYAQERMAGITNSRYTRTITGHAFSNADPFTERSIDNTHFCSDLRGKVHFSAKKDEKSNWWTFNFVTLNGHNIYSTKKGKFWIHHESPLGVYTPDVLDPNEPQYQPDPNGKLSTSWLDSLINPNERAVVRSDKDNLFLSWVGTDPQDSFSNVEFVCHPNNGTNLPSSSEE